MQLPVDIVCEIIKYLLPLDQLALMLVNKRLYQVLKPITPTKSTIKLKQKVQHELRKCTFWIKVEMERMRKYPGKLEITCFKWRGRVFLMDQYGNKRGHYKYADKDVSPPKYRWGINKFR